MSGLRKTPSTGERIVAAAADLFYSQGINTSGVDAIAEAAGVSKPTLYNLFGSKQAVVVEALRRSAARRELLWGEILRGPGTPETRILQIFDWLDQWFQEPDFRGCALLNAAAELSSDDVEARRVVTEHKDWVVAALHRVAAEGEWQEPAGLARGLFLLIEGATAAAFAAGKLSAARDAHAAARRLIASHSP
ncbi:MAG TPA: TetR/AcrR family transcriptional regulator [Longimicrobiaceae bacterium]|nr:TetR/AcrR family transcriptional regulator [Longimicrobiaceae bacterium]